MWKYGTAGDKWPVRVGDIWTAGPNPLACLDLETPMADAFYGNLREPLALVYSDPPWDTGNAKSFRTKAGLPHDGVTVTRLWHRIMSLVVSRLAPSGDLYLEIGTRHRDDAARWMADAGRPMSDQWPIVYYDKHPCWLLRSASIPRMEQTTPAGLDDELTPEWAVAASTQPGDLVCDPCSGRGLTVCAAQRAGRRFVGTELHPRRMAIALDRLARLGLEPRKVGEL